VTAGSVVRTGTLQVADEAERAGMEKTLALIDRDRKATEEQRRARRIAALQEAGYLLDAAREAGTLHPARTQAVPEGWRDCDACPELVTVPAGRIELNAAKVREKEEFLAVEFAQPFAIARRETTLGEYRQFLRRTGYLPRDEWMQVSAKLADELPVTGLWHNEINAYLRWLGRHTGKSYRLPTDYEWEYVARAGAATGFWWGNDEAGACGRDWEWRSLVEGCPSVSEAFMPVGMLAANPFGVYDMYGNALERVRCTPGAQCTGDTGVQGGPLYSPGSRAGNYGLHSLAGFRVARDLR
jgi:formylglycine-generating enzyme required for sulfatase activity